MKAQKMDEFRIMNVKKQQVSHMAVGEKHRKRAREISMTILIIATSCMHVFSTFKVL